MVTSVHIFVIFVDASHPYVVYIEGLKHYKIIKLIISGDKLAQIRHIWDNLSPLCDIYVGTNIIMSILTCSD